MQTSGKMPSVPAGDQGGFVPATDVMTEMIRIGASAPANADDATASSVGAAPAAAGLVAAVPGGPRAMRWNNNTSGFILRRMAQLLSDGSRPDKVFKDKDVNSVAKALKEYSGEAVSPTQVYNHLRKWRQKWSRVSKLKDLSGALWDSDSNAILLDQEHYLGHCKDHPKDAEFLNCPIRFYTEMEAIFGHAMATSKFALGSGEALGQNQVDSVAAKVEGPAFTYISEERAQTDVGEGSKATENPSIAVGRKRKRGNFSEDEMLMLTNMSDAVNNVANALRETGPAHVDANLYLAVMEMPGYSEEALIVAYTFLLDNKAQGRGFVHMTEAHRNIWLRTFLAKNYYM
ncbi:uncharacterized protein [Zea mays]|uniref:uncharacterized protein n=1 Tax=Zea mays TaxID=4577 RepID=UPI001651F9BD|nr:uncharacterized protein LOC103645715 [Zea mays]